MSAHNLQQNSGSSVRLVQITDPHLFAETTGTLVGMNCEEGMRDVLDLVTQEEDEIAAVLCTGDISQDHSPASYQRFLQAVATLNAAQYWIAGNHDEIPVMVGTIGRDNPCFTRHFTVPGWHIIMLNSNVPGEVHGKLDDRELNFLQQRLDASIGSHVLVCVHHNCVPVAAPWLQQHALQNTDALFAVLDRHTHVKAVVFGHIHQELVHERKQVLYLASPSTSIQFKPVSDNFALDDVNPGYRWLELFANGELRTGIRRVSGKRYNIDFSGTGY